MRGLFVGLATLDVIQLVKQLPEPDQKIRALDFTLAAGGPATNAAVAFAHTYPDERRALSRNDEATLVTRISRDHIGDLIRADLDEHGVTTQAVDLPEGVHSTVASILVTESTGERAVVSLADERGTHVSSHSLGIDVDAFDIVETDGYETDLTLNVLKQARSAGIMTVLDGGSMKSYTEDLLPLIDIAIVSDVFAQGRTTAELFTYLHSFGVQYAAFTHGAYPIEYSADGDIGVLETCTVQVRDTLGAGDFFHGGFTKAIAGQKLDANTFIDALSAGARVASRSIQSFGTRSWLMT